MERALGGSNKLTNEKRGNQYQGGKKKTRATKKKEKESN